MRDKTYRLVKILIFCVLTVQIIVPLVVLLSHITPDNIVAVFTSNQFLPMLKNSFVSTTLATLVSVSLALALAWCVHRTNIRHKNAISILFTVPMLIPSISHGLGLTILFGDNGVFTNLTGINIHLFGLTGIVLGATLYAFPSAFLIFTNIFQYEDFTTYEVANVLGLTKWQCFVQITFPNIKKTLISATFAVFSMIFTDYGIPLVVGGKMTTLPVYMYREVVGLLDYSKGGVLGAVLLIPAVMAFVIDMLNQDVASAGTVTKPYQIRSNKRRDFVAACFCGIVLFLISIPIFTFALLCFVNHYPVDFSLTFNNIKEALHLGVMGYMRNALFISLTTALVGTVTAYLTAFYTARSSKKISSMALHMISLITLSVPGIVLGLSYVLTFKSTIIYGTFTILIGVNMIHFFSSPYLMAYNAMLKFNSNLEDVAKTLGLSRMKVLRDVFLPCTYDTVLEMFSYIFANSMVTISAVSFLANFRNMPIAMLIPQFDSQSLIGAIAVISALILFVNITMKLIIYTLKKHFNYQEA